MKKRQINFYVLGLLFSHITYANMCDIALNSGAFNTEDFSQSSALFMQKRDDVCESEYNSEAEAKSAMRASGASIGYAGFTVGATSAKETTSGKYSIKDSKYCHASASSVDSMTTSTGKKQVANIALQTWLACIEKTDTNKLFVKYNLMPDATGLTGTIIRSATYNEGVITGIMTAGEDISSQITCSIGTEFIEVNKEIGIVFKKSKTNFQCRKDEKNNIRIALNTNEGAQPWISLPSLEQKEQTTIDELNEKINLLSLRNSIPVGTVMAYSGDIASLPSGWMVCNGAKVKEGEFGYMELRNIIGFTYGGSLQEKFLKVPDFGGYFLRGINSLEPLDKDGARQVGSSQNDSTKLPNNAFQTLKDGSHQHTYSSNNMDPNRGGKDGYWYSSQTAITPQTTGDSTHVHTISIGGDAETRPINKAVYWIIKVSSIVKS